MACTKSQKDRQVFAMWTRRTLAPNEQGRNEAKADRCILDNVQYVVPVGRGCIGAVLNEVEVNLCNEKQGADSRTGSSGSNFHTILSTGGRGAGTGTYRHTN